MELGDSEPEDNSTTTSGTPVQQITVFLDNRAGALLGIVQMLNDNNVVVLGLSVLDSIDATIVRLIASDPETVQTLFMEKGIAYSVTEILVVELPNGAVQLPQCLRTLLNAETNIHFLYPIMTRPHGKTSMALCVEDNEFGRRVLDDEGYHVLMQEDLSR